MRPGFFSTAVGAAYALFNAFEFSRKISLNVISKNLKNDGSRIHFVILFMYFTSSTPTNFWTFEGIQKQ